MMPWANGQEAPLAQRSVVEVGLVRPAGFSDASRRYQDAREAPQRSAKEVPYPVLSGCSHLASCITCFSTSLALHPEACLLQVVNRQCLSHTARSGVAAYMPALPYFPSGGVLC